MHVQKGMLEREGNTIRQKTYEDEESLEDIKKLPRASLVAALDALTNYIDHSGKQVLERFLEQK